VHAFEDFMRFHVKALQLGHGQVDAAALGVFAHVADDVGELKRQAELVRVLGRHRFGLAKNMRRHFTDDAGHQMAVALQAGVVEVARLHQVHLAAFDHGDQMALLDAVVSRQRHQRLHHRVRGLPGKGGSDFIAPPRQFGLRDARVGYLINDVVHLTAKRIKRGDGGTPYLGQEQKGVVETAARTGGFLLDVLLWGHGVMVVLSAHFRLLACYDSKTAC
jgi:hypothetical protein